MSLHAVIFYLLAAVIITATVLAVTRRNLVHSVIYLILSFFGSAMLYYLFGAPFLAALEIIIYAGAIMVLFLFIVMMLRVEKPSEPWRPLRQWLPAILLAFSYLPIIGLLVAADPQSKSMLKIWLTRPRTFGRFLFQNYWFAVELIALLLFVALIGALYLGKTPVSSDQQEESQ
ncbi:MAG: NADH-quinone oxidoreductase subunit J [Deltaproteobacteria bacterium]|nr:NADH-quinone oxidoreductase subunit J [Deltaproteobacteria bacterium]MBW2072086.1 NADH-quinone oxidoreductase subunit J [Deltaproteobacteria bacterium]